MDLSLQFPLDIQKAIELLSGERNIYFTMLGKFEVMSLVPVMTDMALAVNLHDHLRIKNKAH